MSEHMLVMSKANPGAEAAYVDWYRTRHLPDMLNVPGVDGGGVYELVEGDAAPWGVAALYGLSTTVADVLPEIFARAGGDAMPLTDTIDGSSVLMLGLEAIGPQRLAEPAIDRSGATRYLVLTNPADGEDEAFNAWYDDRHLGDVLAIPGFVAAQRFRIAPETAGKESPWRYLAVFELSRETAAEAMSEMQARAGTDLMPISPALDGSGVYAQLFGCVRELPA